MSVESGEEAHNSRHACAACKHQRKKCQNDCIFAPYFPSTRANNFREVHRIFGVKNMTVILENLSPDERQKAVASLEWEALAWKEDPVQGPLGLLRQQEHKFELLRNQQNPQQNTMLAMFNHNSSGIVPDTNMNATNLGYASVPNYGLDETMNNYAGLLQRADNIEGLGNYSPPVVPNYYPPQGVLQAHGVPQGQRRHAVSQTSSLSQQQEMQRNIITGTSSTLRHGFNQEHQHRGNQGRYHPYYNGSICGSQRRGLHLGSNIADK